MCIGNLLVLEDLLSPVNLSVANAFLYMQIHRFECLWLEENSVLEVVGYECVWFLLACLISDLSRHANDCTVSADDWQLSDKVIENR